MSSIEWPLALIKDYAIDDAVLIGSGGYGHVYRLLHRQTNEYVAVKVVDKRRLAQDNDLHSIGIELSALVQSHSAPYIVQLYQVEEASHHVFIVQEYLSSGDLHDELEKHGRLPLKAVQQRFSELLLAVSHLHRCGIAVRDIKPENVMYNHHGQCILIDLGLASAGNAVEDSSSSLLAHTRCGTQGYTAPEVQGLFQGQSYNPFQADVWSLGCVLFAMFHGQPPYDDVEDSEESDADSEQSEEAASEGSHRDESEKRAKQRQHIPFGPWVRPETQDLMRAMLEAARNARQAWESEHKKAKVAALQHMTQYVQTSDKSLALLLDMRLYDRTYALYCLLQQAVRAKRALKALTISRLPSLRACSDVLLLEASQPATSDTLPKHARKIVTQQLSLLQARAVYEIASLDNNDSSS
eukprot:TRINITY_DN7042_c0_g3_i3.p1 TRINITY_DN7042_c0_g3~~TRINITY_DN7042_c0_g3_i3.p1  ORF type:complete len:411 (+),score=61.89 TRINITY_DN7042_c0_g3_i3:50-1282(+)